VSRNKFEIRDLTVKDVEHVSEPLKDDLVKGLPMGGGNPDQCVLQQTVGVDKTTQSPLLSFESGRARDFVRQIAYLPHGPDAVSIRVVENTTICVEDTREETSQECGEPSVVFKATQTRPNSVRKSSFEGLGEGWQGDRQERFTFIFGPKREPLSVTLGVDRAEVSCVMQDGEMESC
jgi:hypothetical protein